MSCLVLTKDRKPVVVAMPAEELDRHLFHTDAVKVMVPTPSGRPTWLTVNNVRAVEAIP
jgi:hypothetical protein